MLDVGFSVELGDVKASSTNLMIFSVRSVMVRSFPCFLVVLNNVP